MTHCVTLFGSPPRVRGKPVFRAPAAFRNRITPACAGKTSTSPPRCPYSTDHPRVCGENLSSLNAALRRSGSPPRVRGKQSPRLPHGSRGRITPACAGKTPQPASLLTGPADHPRVCGENMSGTGGALNRYGSPPRVRGKRARCPSARSGARITPACAGKTE